jgi:hypothetical protein
MIEEFEETENVCKYILMKGDRRGFQCKKKCGIEFYCSTHLNNPKYFHDNLNLQKRRRSYLLGRLDRCRLDDFKDHYKLLLGIFNYEKFDSKERDESDSDDGEEEYDDKDDESFVAPESESSNDDSKSSDSESDSSNDESKSSDSESDSSNDESEPQAAPNNESEPQDSQAPPAIEVIDLTEDVPERKRRRIIIDD